MRAARGGGGGATGSDGELLAAGGDGYLLVAGKPFVDREGAREPNRGRGKAETGAREGTRTWESPEKARWRMGEMRQKCLPALTGNRRGKRLQGYAYSVGFYFFSLFF